MAIVNVSFTVAVIGDPDDSGPAQVVLEPVGAVYVFYAGVWIWSIYVQFFEYKRGLPHSWYCH
jgi:hypothetical protein